MNLPLYNEINLKSQHIFPVTNAIQLCCTEKQSLRNIICFNSTKTIPVYVPKDIDDPIGE